MSIPTTMRAVMLTEYSRTGLQIRETAVPQPKEGEASPINPSDLATVYGAYAEGRQELPFIPGKEGSGLVVASGGGARADGLVGKRVAAFSTTGIWCEYITTSVKYCVPLKDEITYQQGACFFGNPLTVIMFEQVVRERGKGGAIHSAAGSQVGKMLIRLCAQEGIPLINIVRREEQIPELLSEGAQHVLCSESPDFQQRIHELSRELNANVFFDAVGGELTGKVLREMPDGSTVFTYGMLSKQGPGGIDGGDIIFRGKKVEGLWLVPWLAGLDVNQIVGMYGRVMEGLNGVFATSFAVEVGFDGFLEALRNYMTNMSAGKVLLRPSGDNQIQPYQTLTIKSQQLQMEQNPSQNKLQVLFHNLQAQLTVSTFRANIRSWPEFFTNLSQPKFTAQEIKPRLEKNLLYYSSNYMIITLLFMLITILSDPYFLVCLAVLAGFWYYLNSLKSVNIGGKELTEYNKNLLMIVLTLVITVLLEGAVICIVLGSCVICSVLHSVFHNIPQQEDELEITIQNSQIVLVQQ